MAKRRTITEEVGDYRLVWTVGQKMGQVQMYDVCVYRGEGPEAHIVMEWSYPRVKGCGGLLGHVSFWRDQAVLQAKAEEVEHGK